ncbi:hypothetical protein RhiirA5_442337 [Rhizophagus irregularis]|uniref:Uncharacterized protein n=1 Tax=Rhizophagus irregularis TaxID=588596 RepID=A0A2N0NEU8_9GLOM|nr:hypothetical protein RhiirA5_442337 [Rhizophagus irregularis]GET53236.1 hypothetical protein RIR_e24809_A0A2N0NEU8_9GLOM [Rhizophagus irregularis DAOM 181602=DAOM 197198]
MSKAVNHFQNYVTSTHAFSLLLTLIYSYFNSANISDLWWYAMVFPKMATQKY